jgi:F420-0:gamma-glutamyl ligase
MAHALAADLGQGHLDPAAVADDAPVPDPLAASLLMGQASEGVPAVLARGLDLRRVPSDASVLLRPKEMDLFR